MTKHSPTLQIFDLLYKYFIDSNSDHIREKCTGMYVLLLCCVVQVSRDINSCFHGLVIHSTRHYLPASAQSPARRGRTVQVMIHGVAVTLTEPHASFRHTDRRGGGCWCTAAVRAPPAVTPPQPAEGGGVGAVQRNGGRQAAHAAGHRRGAPDAPGGRSRAGGWRCVGTLGGPGGASVSPPHAALKDTH